MNKCKYCKSDSIKEDRASGMWYCHNCSRFLDGDEVEFDNEQQAQEEEEEPAYEEEELTGLSLLVLNVLMWVPIFNILVVCALNKSDVKSQYRKSFSYKFITDMVLFLIAFIFLICMVYNYKFNISNSIHAIVSNAADFLDSAVSYDIDVPDFESKNIMQIIESMRVEEEENTDWFVLDWRHFDGVVINGQSLLDLLEETGLDFVILMQTDEIRNRYTKTSYRNMGYIIDGSEVTGSTGNYFYDGKLPDVVSLYTDDYGELLYTKVDDLYSRRYVYYLNPKYDYRVRVLFDENSVMVGFAFEEIKE